MKNELMNAGRVPGARITVIYPGLNTSEFADYSGPLPEIPGCNSCDKVVMYAGSTHSYQGLALLAQAQEQLVARRSDVFFVLVLSGNTSEDVVENFGFDCRYTRVIRPGGSSELPGFFKRADVLIHARPPCLDNINVQSKLGLYLASGKPIVATNIGDYTLIMGASRGCVLTDPAPARIAEAVAAALDDPEIRHNAARSNPELARRYFEADRNYDRLLHVYRSAAGKGLWSGLPSAA
jgi:glycosyltransferase involved in cell wall biosynthesis